MFVDCKLKVVFYKLKVVFCKLKVVVYKLMMDGWVDGCMTTQATFALRTLENPQLREAHKWHAASSLLGGALFVADGFFPDTPYIHAAWHVAAAFGVATLKAVL